MRRGLAFDTVTDFPVPVDLLVYTTEEWARLRHEETSFVHRLCGEIVWLASDGKSEDPRGML
jgi:hypothetical protein